MYIWKHVVGKGGEMHSNVKFYCGRSAVGNWGQGMAFLLLHLEHVVWGEYHGNNQMCQLDIPVLISGRQQMLIETKIDNGILSFGALNLGTKIN